MKKEKMNTAISMSTKILVIKLGVIDGLQLRHSFFPPKRLDVKTPLQNIGRYLKSMYNSFSGNVLRI